MQDSDSGSAPLAFTAGFYFIQRRPDASTGAVNYRRQTAAENTRTRIIPPSAGGTNAHA